MMTNTQAAAHKVDRNGRLHRPDGTFATNTEAAAYCATLYLTLTVRAAFELCAAANRRKVRSVLHAEGALPEMRPRKLWKVESERIARAKAWGFTN